MLRMCALTVFGETDSWSAISGRDRFVGRYRGTRSSPGLSSSADGGEDCCRAAGDAPCRTSRMSASSAPSAVWCRSERVGENVGADAIELSAGQLNRLNDVEPPVGDRHADMTPVNR
jgi:hypothetical protein